MNKTYFVYARRGTNIRYYDGITIGDIENTTFEQGNEEEILSFVTKEEALAELAKHKNSAWFYGNSKLIESEVYYVTEWEVDSLCTGKNIAYAEWDEVNLD